MAVDSETGFKLDLLQALDWLKMSWDNVTPITIKYCYQHVGFKDVPATEDTQAPDTSIWSSVEEAGLVSDGLSFDYVALDGGVAIGPGAEGLEVDDILNILHPEVLADDDVDIAFFQQEIYLALLLRVLVHVRPVLIGNLFQFHRPRVNISTVFGHYCIIISLFQFP